VGGGGATEPHTVLVNPGIAVSNLSFNSGNAFIDGLGTRATTAVSGIMSGITGFLNDPVGSVSTGVQNVWNGITHPVTTAQNVVTGAGHAATNTVGATQTVITGAGTLTTNGIGHVVSGVTTFIGNPIGTIADGIEHAWNSVTHPITTAQNILTGLGNALNTLTGTESHTNAIGGQGPVDLTTPRNTSSNENGNSEPGGGNRPSGAAGTNSGGGGGTVQSRYQQTGVGPLSGSESTGGRSKDDPIDTGGAGTPNNGAGENNAGHQAN
jgi:hypothetical protein